MKKWSLNIKSKPTEISEKLEAALADRFVLTIKHGKNNSVTFKMRKRILYIWYMYFHNWTIVSGKLLRTEKENITKVDISFSHHWFIVLIIYSQMLLGLRLLIPIVFGVNGNTSYYIFGCILLAVGVVLWFVVKKKFETDIQKYKALIFKILEP